MFGLGHWELLIILGIVVLVFGASRLPALGRGLGEGMRGFRDALRGEGDREAPGTKIQKAAAGKSGESSSGESSEGSHEEGG